MDKQIPALGAVPSPHDYRDDYAKVALGAPQTAPFALPASFETSMPGPVLMQAQIPACVSHSVAQVLQLYWYKKTGKLIDFSPRFLDVLAKRFDGQPLDGGTIPRLVFKLAVKYGCATTATVPNDTSLSLAQYRNDSILTPAAFTEALQHKIPGFIRVPDSFDAVRQAVYFHGAVSTLMEIGKEWWTNTSGTSSWVDSEIDPLRIPVVQVGGHQIVVKGWTDNDFNTLRNSWSDKWANIGEAKYDFANWAPYIIEGWTVAEIPEDVKDFMATLPAPTDFHYTWNTNMSLGQTNEDIKFMQIALMILGFISPFDPSQLGIYGPKTAVGVLAYQKSKKINPPSANNVGPMTRAALNADFSI